MITRKHFLRTLIITALFVGLFSQPNPALALSDLTLEPITWNVVGLDSNNVTVGPDNFPVGIRACNPGSSTTSVNNISATFNWTSANTYIDLRSGSLNPITPGVNLAPGDCYDFYFEVTVDRNAGAYDTFRRYRIDVTGTDSGTAVQVSASTPVPREIYVEHLISQSRNSTTDVLLDTVSVAPGGTMVSGGK